MDKKEQIVAEVYTALGAASMCWSEIPQGVFDDVNANKIGKDLVYKILALSHPKEVETNKEFEFCDCGYMANSNNICTGCNLPKKEVDLEDLRERFNEEMCKGLSTDTIWNFFLPHLQTPVESDAVEFAEWISENGWVKRTATHPKNVGKYWSHIHCVYYTITELYEQFKQLKK